MENTKFHINDLIIVESNTGGHSAMPGDIGVIANILNENNQNCQIYFQTGSCSYNGHNIGRVLPCALGYSGQNLQEEDVKLFVEQCVDSSTLVPAEQEQ